MAKKIKKKVNQHRDFERAIGDGGLIDIFYILRINRQWWACRKGRQWGGCEVIHNGESYCPIVPVNYFSRPSGTRILGYINKIKTLQITVFLFKFVFVKDVFESGYGLQKVCKQKELEFINKHGNKNN